MPLRCCFKRSRTRKVVIIGGGFAGLQAARTLSCCSELEVELVDKGACFTFLPLLPDTIGRALPPSILACSLVKLCKRYRVCYAEADVQSIDLEKRLIVSSGAEFDYDYLVIASGSQTNFYDNRQLIRHAFKLDDALDAEAIGKVLASRRPDVYVIGGGGYTGIEVAANLRLLTQRRAALSGQRQLPKVVIVERAAAVLGQLPRWIGEYVQDNLGRMGIELRTGSTVAAVDGETVETSAGERFENAMLFWTAGVRTADFIQALPAEKNAQGRLAVDGFLRLRDNVLVAGDAALVSPQGRPLRMAAQFALSQGRHAARNLIRIVRGQRPHPYVPADAGYIIPMANDHSCGEVFGRPVRGRLATMLHYLMCVYRSCGVKNKWCVLDRLTRRLV